MSSWLKGVLLAVIWGVVASAIAFWLNILLDRVEFPSAVVAISISATVEETAKYLGVRRCRAYSLCVPIVFLFGESVVQSYQPPFPASLSTVIVASFWALIAMKHIAFYALIYLAGYRVYSLPLAIGLHTLWNLYAAKPVGEDILLLGFLCLVIVVLPPIALCKFEKKLLEV